MCYYGSLLNILFNKILSRFFTRVTDSNRVNQYLDSPFNYRMGEIIFWALVRFLVVLAGAWLYGAGDSIEQRAVIFFVAVSAVVIYPAQLSYRKHERRVKRASSNALCASCKHFVSDSTLCAVLDVHVTRAYSPCEGEAWEPLGSAEF